MNNVIDKSSLVLTSEYSYIFVHFTTPISEYKENKHNTELQRTDPGTKDVAEFSTRNRIFPLIAQNGFLLFPSFLLRQIHLNDRSHAMVVSIITSTIS